MPFALNIYNSSRFSKMDVDKIFKNLKDFCVVYIDDILVFSKTMEEYKKHLKVVCEKIKNKKYVESIVL